MDDREKWNLKYKEKLLVSAEPKVNARLEKLVTNQAAGSAIELACGLGANSFYLASLGFDVTAVDVSEVALNFVREQAEQKGMEIRTRLADLTHSNSLLDFIQEYDLVVMTYYLDRAMFPLMKSLVKPGGYLFMETFYTAENGGKPQISSKYKLTSNELLSEFGEWKVIYFHQYEEDGVQTIFCRKI